MTTAPTVLTIRHLSKYFGDHAALNNISFDLHKGEILGFVGPNGAGKTTLMSTLLGLITADNGTAEVYNPETKKMCHYKHLTHPHTHIGVVIDPLDIKGRETIWQHFYRAAALYYSKDRATTIARKAIHAVGLDTCTQRQLNKLSMGMKMRVSIGLAIMHNPHIVIMDEPTNGLDPDGIYWLQNQLQAMARKGTAIMLSSHQLDQISKIIDGAVIIGKGTVIKKASMKDFSNTDNERVEIVVEQGMLNTVGNALEADGFRFTVDPENTGENVIVFDATHTPREIGRWCAHRQVVLLRMTQQEKRFSDVYQDLVENSVEFKGLTPQ